MITNPQSIGAGYAGIAILHAKGQNASEVIFAPDMNRALGQYANQLASMNDSGTRDINKRSDIKSLSGRIHRIGAIPGNTQTPTSWVFMLEGDTRTFTIGRDTYSKIPMIKEGDRVNFTYLEIAGDELAVSTFSCDALDNAGKAQAQTVEAKPKKQ